MTKMRVWLHKFNGFTINMKHTFTQLCIQKALRSREYSQTFGLLCIKRNTVICGEIDFQARHISDAEFRLEWGIKPHLTHLYAVTSTPDGLWTMLLCCGTDAGLVHASHSASTTVRMRFTLVLAVALYSVIIAVFRPAVSSLTHLTFDANDVYIFQSTITHYVYTFIVVWFTTLYIHMQSWRCWWLNGNINEQQWMLLCVTNRLFLHTIAQNYKNPTLKLGVQVQLSTRKMSIHVLYWFLATWNSDWRNGIKVWTETSGLHPPQSQLACHSPQIMSTFSDLVVAKHCIRIHSFSSADDHNSDATPPFACLVEILYYGCITFL